MHQIHKQFSGRKKSDGNIITYNQGRLLEEVDATNCVPFGSGETELSRQEILRHWRWGDRSTPLLAIPATEARNQEAKGMKF
jgi:hypothetical protein